MRVGIGCASSRCTEARVLDQTQLLRERYAYTQLQARSMPTHMQTGERPRDSGSCAPTFWPWMNVRIDEQRRKVRIRLVLEAGDQAVEARDRVSGVRAHDDAHVALVARLSEHVGGFRELERSSGKVVVVVAESHRALSGRLRNDLLLDSNQLRLGTLLHRLWLVGSVTLFSLRQIS